MTKYVKYGGMKFEEKAPPEEINAYVEKLPPDKKQSLHQVVQELEDKGFIKLYNEVTTIDDEMIEWQETNSREKK